MDTVDGMESLDLNVGTSFEVTIFFYFILTCHNYGFVPYGKHSAMEKQRR